MLTTWEIFQQLEPDPWRADAGFSKEVAAAQAELFQSSTDEQVQKVLSDWLDSRHQPCLFAKIAVKRDLLSFCVLRESDLEAGDDALFHKIQEARLRWTRDAFNGKRSGFIVFLLSERVARCRPSVAMMDLSKRLCSLYLFEEQPIQSDRIHMEEVFLEASIEPRLAWRWSAGVNFFCAQGDLRWWADHRIPGGLAFSVNSVGHMAKSRSLDAAMRDLRIDLGVADEELSKQPIDSLHKALEFAMRTIDKAAEMTSGRATELLPSNSDPSQPTCPIALTGPIENKDHCTYLGYYDTDQTLPAVYFLDDVERPGHVEQIPLDFTYLFDDRLDNPDFLTMGRGRRIRTDSTSSQKLARRRRSLEDQIPVGQHARLTKALAGSF